MTIFNSDSYECTSVINDHVSWPFLRDFHSGLYILMIIFNSLLAYDDFGYIVTAFSFLTAGFAYSFNRNYFASMWCFSAISVPLFALIYQL